MKAYVTIKIDFDSTEFDIGRLKTLYNHIKNTLDTSYITMSYSIGDLKPEKEDK